VPIWPSDASAISAAPHSPQAPSEVRWLVACVPSSKTSKSVVTPALSLKPVALVCAREATTTRWAANGAGSSTGGKKPLGTARTSHQLFHPAPSAITGSDRPSTAIVQAPPAPTRPSANAVAWSTSLGG
jgi:hypothetical protein